MTLPSVDEFVKGHNLWPLLPLPMPEPVLWRRLKSCRLRQRQKRRLQVGRMLKSVICTINALGEGHVSQLTSPLADAGCRMKATAARSLAVHYLRLRVVDLARVRRGLGLTGVRDATATLLKSSPDADGYVRAQRVKQVPMIADRMVEPKGEEVIDMLSALPAEDAMYYSKEDHVVCRDGKSEAIFREIEEHYGFVGGTLEQYLKYLGRADVSHLWEWDLMTNIKAIAGVSVVLKKNGVDQRKLVMQVAANYMFGDPTQRAHLGMGGGSALSRCFVGSDHMAVAACDEDSAFTYVKIPTWMSYWQAGPPVRASQSWHLLPDSVKNLIVEPEETFVAPRYLRLAMGGSHSVYILMRINLHHIGKTLFGYAARLLNQPELDDGHVRMDNNDGCDEVQQALDNCSMKADLNDVDWELRQQARRLGQTGSSGYTVEGWCEAVRRTKQLSKRVFVVIHMFAGERRPGDIQEHLEALMQQHELELLMLSVDLAVDPLWDFRNPSTFHNLMQLTEEGLIDFWIGGPPCSTVARSRHVKMVGGGGPRPLRFRWALWGRPDLRQYERERVAEANDLWVNFWAMAEGVSARGGGYLMEHPSDPGVEPYPSMWLIPDLIEMEARANARRVHFDQCPFGGIAPKATTFSGNLEGMEEIDNVRCPGVSKSHQHGKSIGRAPDGSFYTRRLQTYPSDLCWHIAKMLYLTIDKMMKCNSGPTGALSNSYDVAAPRITSWSVWSTAGKQGVVLLNEATARSQSLLINCGQSATYVHVDDTVFISDAKAKQLHGNRLLDEAVSGLEAVGFQVTQQVRAGDLEKVVGYEVVEKPAQFRLPLKRAVLLQIALRGLAGQRKVAVDTLRSLVGMWIFGSLLKRELLSIPHAVFHFMDEFDGMIVPWWETARQEVKAMANLMSQMFCHVGSPISKWLFATDAMGQNHIDYGGYGIAMTEIDEAEIRALLKQGEVSGKTIARMDGSQGTKYPDRALVPTVPFSLLPTEFFEKERWHPVCWGRWKFGDHITIGESRTVLKLMQRLATWPCLHGQTYFSLQDNYPTACAMAKGRSPAFALNRVLRQKAGVCIAARLRLFLPWTESAKQPADELSRIQ